MEPAPPASGSPAPRKPARRRGHASPALPPLATPPLPDGSRASLPGAVGGAAAAGSANNSRRPARAASRHVGGSRLSRSVDRAFESGMAVMSGARAATFIQAYVRGKAERMQVALLIAAATRIQSRWRGLAARRLWLKMKRAVENIAWVVLCDCDSSAGEPSAEVTDLIRRLEDKPLQLIHFPSRDRRRYFIAVSATDEDLYGAAEDMGLRMFLKPKPVHDLEGKPVDLGGPAWFGGMAEFMDSARHEFIPASQLEAYIDGTPPDEGVIPAPEEDGGPSFFNSGERQRIIKYIIEQTGDKIDMDGTCTASLCSLFLLSHEAAAQTLSTPTTRSAGHAGSRRPRRRRRW